MKKSILTKRLSIAILFLSGLVYSQNNVIKLTPLGTGSEGENVLEDISVLNVNATGKVSTTDATPDWTVVSGGINLSAAFDTNLSIKMKAVRVIDQTVGTNYGAATTLGGIDRASTGEIGVRTTTGGIDQQEGLIFGFDLTSLPSTVTLQITKIGINFLAGDETGVIVNRFDTSKKLDLSSSGNKDVTRLGLYCKGGQKNSDMVSLFNNSTVVGNWRVVGIEFKLVDTASVGTK